MSIRLIGRLIGSAGLSALLFGCVAIPADRGRRDAAALLQSRSAIAAEALINSDAIARSDTALTVDDAVRLALRRSPHMQALYAQLGLAQADAYEASRLSNPSLGFMRLTTGDAARTTWTLTQGFTELLFLNYHTRLGRSSVLQAKQQLAQSVLDLEADVRTAYFRYMIANLTMQLHEQSSIAAALSADYAQSLFNAGNISELQLSRERAQAMQSRIELHSAQSNADQHKGALLTVMGVSIHDGYEFLDRLDVPVEQSLQVAALQLWAEQQRVDIAMLREQVSMLKASNTHARRWFWLSNAELQLEREREADGTTLSGAGASVGLPLFNQGGGVRLRTQSRLEQVQAELQGRQLAMNNDVVVQLAGLQRAGQVVADYRQQLIPLQERVLELVQQQQNYMFIGTVDLLNAKREVLRTYQDYLRATGEYWIQHVALSRTVGGRLPDSAGEATYGISVGVEALPDSEVEPASPHSHTEPSAGATP